MDGAQVSRQNWRMEHLVQDVLDGTLNAHSPRLSEVERLRLQLVERTVSNILSGTTWKESKDLSLLRPEPAVSPSMKIERWLSDGRIFSIQIRGRRMIPAYALDELGEPLPTLKPVLAELAGLSDFSVAAWFEAPSSLLDGKRPREVVAVNGPAVVLAARAMMTGPVHG